MTKKDAILATINIHEYAIREDIEYYSAKNILNEGNCPLCEQVDREKFGEYGFSGGPCEKCLWNIHEGHLCEYKLSDDAKYDYEYENSKLSIIRLNRWLKLEDEK